MSWQTCLLTYSWNARRGSLPKEAYPVNLCLTMGKRSQTTSSCVWRPHSREASCGAGMCLAVQHWRCPLVGRCLWEVHHFNKTLSAEANFESTFLFWWSPHCYHRNVSGEDLEDSSFGGRVLSFPDHIGYLYDPLVNRSVLNFTFTFVILLSYYPVCMRRGKVISLSVVITTKISTSRHLSNL